ncbi:DUF1292 domain-containing protein [Paenibacillus aquistagni]|uniref:DUF1292 domain-containing protein n=1 Tax=Paenibacillus aquistagni TaxID=1852522 RepID=A0A1X7I4D3_9BACL|nr:DUF1292 domain-containing protein [Paenibacillus aquistagni]SMG09084.1 Protein of unknown function [Paenibacillus aquistagni]
MSEAVQLKFIDELSKQYGSALEMTDEEGKSRFFDLLAEFEVDGHSYAIVQDQEGQYEPEALRMVKDEHGTWQLETIDSDEEWEEVMEAYDEVAYSEELDEEQ